MLQPIFTRLSALPLAIHGGLAITAFIAQRLSLTTVNASYERSGHPVDFMTGQTSFSAEKVKGWYQSMIDGGTFDIYFQTQLIDFLFIVSVALFGLFAGSFAARLAKPQHWARALGLAAMVLLPLGAFFDASENLISFFMIANPVDFADWIVLPYSSAAALKFVCIALGFVALAASVLINLPERFVRARKATNRLGLQTA